MKPQSANVKMKVTSSGMVSTFLLLWHTLKLEVATMVLPGPCIDQTFKNNLLASIQIQKTHYNSVILKDFH